MEIVCGTATDLVGKILGFAGSTVGRQVGYLIHYKRNLENLKTEVSKLSAAKESVIEKITVAEAKGEKIYSDVRVWLENVATITKEAQQLLKDKQQAIVEDANNSLKNDDQPKTKCVRGFCPNPMLRRRRSKNSLALVEAVTKLINEEKELSDISYVPPKGLKDLETEVDKLRVAKYTLAEKVAAAKVKGEQIHKEVQVWLKKVAEITEVAEEFLEDKHLQSVEEATELSKDEIQAIENPNASLTHGSKELLELLQGVAELYVEREFSAISFYVPPKEECIASDEDYEDFDSRTSIVEKILKELRSSSSSDMILVYGVGGVGKTTLVEEVLRKTQKEALFQDVVMVRDVKVPNLEAIQKQLADKLGLHILDAQTLPGRADKINERIKNNNTLVIFDDVWEEIDFKAVGLPHKSTCRILLTSRSKQVFSYTIKQKEFPLGVLNEREAWALFEKKAGDVVADPTIRPVATKVADKCGGLPVLLITVARALENKPIPSWKDALRRLRSFDERGDLTQKAYLGIEWSYSQLSDKEQLQPLFLLCGSIAKGNYISLKMLLAYSIGLGFFEDYTVEDARNALFQQVDKLKSSCLLLDGDDGTCVRMHDLVHDVANRIACRDQHVLVVDGSHEWKKWPNEEFFVQCSKICLPCCKVATFPQASWKCPELELLHLNRDDDDHRGLVDYHSFPQLPSNFFEEMIKLKVLGLRNVLLPSSFLFLKNLQTLCLDHCQFKDTDVALVGELRNLEVLSMVYSYVRQLPKEFGQLTRLRLVDVSYSELQVIPAGVISNWTSLEELRMRHSFERWKGTRDPYGIDQNKPCIASLSELMNLPKLTALEVHIPDASILPPKFFSDRLEKFQISLGGWHLGLMDETTLNTLELELHAIFELDESLKLLLKRCDFFTLNASGGDFSNLMETKVVTSNLTTLNVSDCYHLKYLLTSSMVRSLVKLKYLKVRGCQNMEEIISTTESHIVQKIKIKNNRYVDTIFAKLESLTLEKLPNLARICTAGSCIDFPLLEVLHVKGSSKLGKIAQPKKKKKLWKSATSRGSALFDEKVRFPRLEILKIIDDDDDDYIWEVDDDDGDDEEEEEEEQDRKIWHDQLAPGSFCRLREIHLAYWNGVSSIFPPSMMGRLSGLETLVIQSTTVRVLFDECGETIVKDTHGTTTTHSKDGQNLKSVEIISCHKLRYVFPAAMVARGLQQLQLLKVRFCSGMRNVVGKEEGAVESTTHPRFIFPKVKAIAFDSMSSLESFYPAMHTSEWPSLQYFEYSKSSLECFAAEVSIFQESHLHAPTTQPFFLIDKDSFPVLEELMLPNSEILYGQSSSPSDLMFPKLNSTRSSEPN